ncbi:MAG TPA: ribosome biogenesis GTPase YlqF [Firmicutes bacterium]|nr:ribosome biogenesis GTPase YlqF [Bacillota bacterium]
MAKAIHWFPGHMKKAQNEIIEKIKLVDCVIELLDARIPLSSRNEFLFKVSNNKKRLIVLTKSDLADPILSDQWIQYFKANNITCMFADLNKPSDIKRIVLATEKLGKEKQEKQIAKGMKPQPIRAMIFGIPNVGKSTLINKISNRKAASVMNKPGHTKSQQWIKVSNKFELLDTPGILQSSYEDKEKAINLALTGSINENILPDDFLADYLLTYLKKYYPSLLENRYKVDITLDNENILLQIAKNRGLIESGTLSKYKAIKVLLNEFKSGLIGRVTLERETKCL